MTNLSQNNRTGKSRTNKTNQAQVKNINLQTNIEIITPEIAETWLKRNLNSNRKKSKGHIEYLAQQMKDGHWQLNGQAVKFDTEGNLIDGQHRLSAVVLSGATIQSLIIRGVPGEYFYTLDVGKNRSYSDILSTSGVKNSIATASSILHVFKINRNYAHQSGRMPNNKILEFIDNNPELAESVNYILSLYRTAKYRHIPPSMSIALHFLMRKKDEKQADEMFYKLYIGAGLSINSPILLLRNKLITPKRAQMPYSHKAVYVIKTWKYLRTGKTIKVLSYDPSREKFPKII